MVVAPFLTVNVTVPLFTVPLAGVTVAVRVTDASPYVAVLVAADVDVLTMFWIVNVRDTAVLVLATLSVACVCSVYVPSGSDACPIAYDQLVVPVAVLKIGVKLVTKLVPFQ